MANNFSVLNSSTPATGSGSNVNLSIPTAHEVTAKGNVGAVQDHVVLYGYHGSANVTLKATVNGTLNTALGRLKKGLPATGQVVTFCNYDATATTATSFVTSTNMNLLDSATTISSNPTGVLLANQTRVTCTPFCGVGYTTTNIADAIDAFKFVVMKGSNVDVYGSDAAKYTQEINGPSNVATHAVDGSQEVAEGLSLLHIERGGIIRLTMVQGENWGEDDYSGIAIGKDVGIDGAGRWMTITAANSNKTEVRIGKIITIEPISTNGEFTITSPTDANAAVKSDYATGTLSLQQVEIMFY